MHAACTAQQTPVCRPTPVCGLNPLAQLDADTAACTVCWSQGPGCLAGGVYNFDDVTTDGSLPNRFLGLSWQGLRVTNSQRFSACDGNSGFRYGVISGPNVAYSMEVGASGDMTNLVRITAPTPSSRISVLGFTATAAWQVRLQLAGQAQQRVSTRGSRRPQGYKQ